MDVGTIIQRLKAQDPSLIELRLNKDDINNPQFLELITALEMSLYVQILQIEGEDTLSSLDPEQFEMVCTAIQRSSHLQALELWNNNLDNLVPESFQMLCTAIQMASQLQALGLGANDLGKLDAKRLQMLCTAIQMSVHLKALNLTGCQLTSLSIKRFQMLCTTIQMAPHLQILNLTCNQFGNLDIRRVQILCRAIQMAPQLQILDLTGNGIGTSKSASNTNEQQLYYTAFKDHPSLLHVQYDTCFVTTKRTTFNNILLNNHMKALALNEKIKDSLSGFLLPGPDLITICNEYYFSNNGENYYKGNILNYNKSNIDYYRHNGLYYYIKNYYKHYYQYYAQKYRTEAHSLNPIQTTLETNNDGTVCFNIETNPFYLLASTSSSANSSNGDAARIEEIKLDEEEELDIDYNSEEEFYSDEEFDNESEKDENEEQDQNEGLQLINDAEGKDLDTRSLTEALQQSIESYTSETKKYNAFNTQALSSSSSSSSSFVPSYQAASASSSDGITDHTVGSSGFSTDSASESRRVQREAWLKSLENQAKRQRAAPQNMTETDLNQGASSAVDMPREKHFKGR